MSRLNKEDNKFLTLSATLSVIARAATRAQAAYSVINVCEAIAIVTQYGDNAAKLGMFIALVISCQFLTYLI